MLYFFLGVRLETWGCKLSLSFWVLRVFFQFCKTHLGDVQPRIPEARGGVTLSQVPASVWTEEKFRPVLRGSDVALFTIVAPLVCSLSALQLVHKPDSTTWAASVAEAFGPWRGLSATGSACWGGRGFLSLQQPKAKVLHLPLCFTCSTLGARCSGGL